MKLRFLQTGGFAGLTRALDVDASALPTAAADSVNALQQLHEAGQLDDATPEARDAQTYHLELTDPQKTVKFRFNDLTIPDAARPLIHYLRQNSKPVNPSSQS
jgi:hypothetical protein